MGRDHSLCVPGWNGTWCCSQRLECVWFCSPQAHKQEDVVEQEHVPARMQELCSQQAGDPQKPTGQGESPTNVHGKTLSGCVSGARAVPGQLQDDGGRCIWHLTMVGRAARCLKELHE